MILLSLSETTHPSAIVFWVKPTRGRAYWTITGRAKWLCLKCKREAVTLASGRCVGGC